MIKTALIGFGGAGRHIHLPLIQAQAEMHLVAVCSSQKDTVRDCVPDVKCYSSPETLFLESGCDLVVIASPNEFHYSLAEQALLSGKHVVVEKPVALHPQEIQNLTVLSEQQNKSLFPFHNRRLDGDFMTIQQLVKQQILGDIKLFESRFDRFRPQISAKWKEQKGSANGLWFDLGPHLLDQTFVLFGLPDAITARLLATRDNSEVCDYFHVTLHYEDKEVLLSANNHQAGPVQRFRLLGSKGSFVKYGLDSQEQQLRQKIAVDSPEFGVEAKEHAGQLFDGNEIHKVTTQKGNYSGFYRDVVSDILNNEPHPVNIEAALNVARFLQLGVLSQQKEKTIKVRQFRN